MWASLFVLIITGASTGQDGARLTAGRRLRLLLLLGALLPRLLVLAIVPLSVAAKPTALRLAAGHGLPPIPGSRPFVLGAAFTPSSLCLTATASLWPGSLSERRAHMLALALMLSPPAISPLAVDPRITRSRQQRRLRRRAYLAWLQPEHFLGATPAESLFG